MSTMTNSHILTRYDLVCPAVFLPLDKLSIHKGGVPIPELIPRRPNGALGVSCKSQTPSTR